MNKASFLAFLAVVFVSALIFTPLFSGWFVQQNYGYFQEKTGETRTTVSYRIIYESHGNSIHALFTLPKSWEKVPVFIIGPAASINKETEQNHLGNELNRLGYATFIIDPRGSGASGGVALPPELDFIQNYQDKEEPYPNQWKMVDDLFRAFEIMSERPDIDSERIFIAGESMSGRHAVIAASYQKEFAGALIISSSGYSTNLEGQDPQLIDYINSINPLYYVGSIESKIAIVHGNADTIIPLEDGKNLFDVATEPKNFYTVEGGGHSFESMDHSVIDEIIEWLES